MSSRSASTFTTVASHSESADESLGIGSMNIESEPMSPVNQEDEASLLEETVPVEKEGDSDSSKERNGVKSCHFRK